MLFTDTIKENKLFSLCYKGKYVSCRFLTCYYRRNRLPYNRMGITAGKKVGGAVERNRAKRIIRAAYRLCEKDMPIGYDMVFVARSDTPMKKTCDVEWFMKKRVVTEINNFAMLREKENGKSGSESKNAVKAKKKV